MERVDKERADDEVNRLIETMHYVEALVARQSWTTPQLEALLSRQAGLFVDTLDLIYSVRLSVDRSRELLTKEMRRDFGFSTEEVERQCHGWDEAEAALAVHELQNLILKLCQFVRAETWMTFEMQLVIEELLNGVNGALLQFFLLRKDEVESIKN